MSLWQLLHLFDSSSSSSFCCCFRSTTKPIARLLQLGRGVSATAAAAAAAGWAKLSTSSWHAKLKRARGPWPVHQCRPAAHARCQK